jgi:ferredoxin
MPVNELPNSRIAYAGCGINRSGSTERSALVKLSIDAGLCQGHGRCYDLAPGLFGDDEEGYGKVLGDGIVPSSAIDDARRSVLNCPEQAIRLIEGE